MQVKYLSALKTKYASYGLSKEALDRVASQRVKTIANEDEIDADIASFDTALLIMKEMQGSADALRSSNAKYQKELASLKEIQPPQEPEPTPNPYAEDMAELRKFMMDMKAEREAERKKTRTEAVLAEVHEKMKAKGCTNDFIRNITLKGVEVAESDSADTIVEKFKPVYDQNCREAFGEGYIPPRGSNHINSETDKDFETKILQDKGLLPKSSN